MTLAFATRTHAPPSKEALSMVSGIIAQCPLVRLTHPTPWVLTWVAYMLSKTAPALPFPATMPDEVSITEPILGASNQWLYDCMVAFLPRPGRSCSSQAGPAA